jgi:hypothetical protein
MPTMSLPVTFSAVSSMRWLTKRSPYSPIVHTATASQREKRKQRMRDREKYYNNKNKSVELLRKKVEYELVQTIPLAYPG